MLESQHDISEGLFFYSIKMNIYRGSDAYHFDPMRVGKIFRDFVVLMKLINEYGIDSVKVTPNQPELLEGRAFEDSATHEHYDVTITPLPSGNPVQQKSSIIHVTGLNIVALDTQGNVYLSIFQKVGNSWQAQDLNILVLSDVVKMESYYLMTRDGRLFFLNVTIDGPSLVSFPTPPKGTKIQDFVLQAIQIYVLLDNGDLYLVRDIRHHPPPLHLTEYDDGIAEHQEVIDGYVVVRTTFHNVSKIRIGIQCLILLQQNQVIVIRYGNQTLLNEDRNIVDVDIETKSSEVILLNNEGYVGLMVGQKVRWITGWGGGFTFQDQGRQSTKSARR